MRNIPANNQLSIESKLLEFLNRNQGNSVGINIFSIALNQNPFLGSVFSWISACYGLSVLQNRKFFILEGDDWRLVPQPENTVRNWHYYFDSLHSHRGFGIFRLLSSSFKKIPVDPRYRILRLLPKISLFFFRKSRNFNNFKLPVTYLRLGKHLERQVGDPRSANSLWAQIPNDLDEVFSKFGFSHWDKNEIWKSFLAREIFHPKLEHLDKYAEFQMLVPSKYIACHCRRGDKVSGKRAESTSIDTSRYLDAVLSVRKITGINDVLLITDSEEFILEFMNESKKINSGLNIHFDPDEVRHNGFPSRLLDNEIDEHNLLVLGEMKTAIKNLKIMAESDFLIGSKASWFFQVAYRIRVSSEDITGDSVSLQSGEEIWGSDFWMF